MKNDFFKKGWCIFPFDPILARWVDKTIAVARSTVRSCEETQLYRCGGTWFAGVNVLPNDTNGAVPGGFPISGKAVTFIRNNFELDTILWDRAQVSVCYPGYPKKMDNESDASFSYRRDRDAAHVDGLHMEGSDRRRYLREYHGFILGIPMVKTSSCASPMVIWEGSHELIRKKFKKIYAEVDPAEWCNLDITGIYQGVRRKIFSTCRRVIINAEPGQAYLVHRLTLHGIASWTDGAYAGPDGRMILYFRPEIGGPIDWLYRL